MGDEGARARPRSRLRNPRVWIGLAITAITIWLTLRDVPFGEVTRVMAQADWGKLLIASVPAYLAVMYLRSLRWRHLTDPIQSIPTGPLFRANAVGFMANNLFPLRIGEIVRAWYLARETNTRTAAILGTVVLERVLDLVTLLAIAFGVLAFGGVATREDTVLTRGTPVLLAVASAPVAFLVIFRVVPERVIAVAAWFARPLPARFGEQLVRRLRQFGAGLGALRGGKHLFWIGFHSATIWLVASVIPFLGGFWAMGIELGSFWRTLSAAWVTMAVVGVAIAVPSSPGFFGPYHLAFREALTQFGVPAVQATAVGTLVHAVFWITITTLGLVVLRSRRTSLGELDRATAGRR